MKKFLFGFLPLLIAAVCLCSLSACVVEDDNDPEILGSWYKTSGSAAYDVYVFGSGGAGSYDRYEKVSGNWIIDSVTFDYTFQGNTLTLTIDGTTYSGTARIDGNTMYVNLSGASGTYVKGFPDLN